jgi:NADH-quinone oxidoreductase subunit K
VSVPLLDLVMLTAVLLFVIGLVGLLVRRNLLLMLMAVELMLNAAGLAFVAAGARWGTADGQVMLLLIFAMAAAELAVGLALVLGLFRDRGTLDADAASSMRG